MSDTVKNESTNIEEQQPQHEEPIQNELSPGAQLSARRQALNWSIEQVASQLNLAPRQIQAIESDNYAALPGIASTRGFIRSYAKLLKIDATALLQTVAKEATTAEESLPLRRVLPEIHFSESRLSPAGKSRWLPRAVFVMVIFFLLAAGLFIAQQAGMRIFPAFTELGAGNGLTVLTSLRTAEVMETGKVLTAGDARADAESHRSGIGLDSVESDPAKTHGIAVNEVAVNHAASAARPAAETAEVAAVRELNGDPKEMLTLKLREDSWIEIKRSDNSTVVSTLFKAGASESFKITGPIVMTVGNAAGVDATLRGKPVEMKANAKNNVARLNLK